MPQAVKAILAYKRDPQSRQYDKGFVANREAKDSVLHRTALHHAAAAGHDNCLKTLIEGQCDIEALSGAAKAETALHLATMHGNLTCKPMTLDPLLETRNQIIPVKT